MFKKNKMKWTYEKILESGKKYSHIFDWETNDRKAYRAAKRHGFFKEATSHMTKKKRKFFSKKISDSEILKIALKFNTPKEWYTSSPSSYSIAHQRKLLNKAISHMSRQIKKPGFYTKEKITESALKFKSISEWNKKEPKFYMAASRQKLMKKFSHFRRPLKKAKYSKNECMTVAKKFNTRKEWKKFEPKTYSFAMRYGFLDECCLHMERLGSMSHRCIYFIKIPVEKLVYVGLTFNYKKRIVEHLISERFKKLINLYGRKSIKTEQATEYLSKDMAAKMENYYIKLLKEQGWKILNKIKGGGLGGKQNKWTEKTILKNILNYSSYKEWMKSESGAYAAALDLNIIEKIDKILPRTPGSYKYWTQKRAKAEAKKWKSKTEFRRNAVGAYEALKKFNVFEEATKHMSDKRLKNFKLT